MFYVQNTNLSSSCSLVSLFKMLLPNANVSSLSFEVENSWKTSFYGDIDVAEGFDAANLYVEFLIKLPSGWFADDKDFELQGRTQKCYVNANDAATFAFPISVNLFRKESTLITEGDFDWPLIMLRVIAIDFWGKHRVRGQGFAYLPRDPARHQIVVRTWCSSPSSVLDRLSEHFLGHDSDELPREWAQQVQSMPHVSQISKTSGTVRLNLNCVTRSDSTDLEQQAKLQNTIADVVLAFERAKKRMLGLRKRHYLYDK